MKRTTDDGDAESATLRSRDCGGVASSSSTPGLGHAGTGRRCLNNQCMVPPEDGSSGYCRQCLSRASPAKTTLPTPTPAQVRVAPLGTIRHRIYRCPRLATLRKRLAPHTMIQRDLNAPSEYTDLGLERALFPIPFTRIPKRASQASFKWIQRPVGDLVMGAFYSDGSLLDGPSELLGRCGWAFVAVDDDGIILAAAHGVTPPWITCIPGAESWAVLLASRAGGNGRFEVSH